MKELPEKIATAALRLITGALAEDPQQAGKQLPGPLYPLYTVRRGEYRAIYRIDDGELIIVTVSVVHRRDV